MTDWPDLMEPVALKLLGEPSRRTTSGEWRYGRKGSLAIHVAGDRAGTWRDHEADAGGGVLDLLEHVEGINRAEALDWLRRHDLLDGAQPPGDAASRLAGAGVVGRRGPPDNRSAGNYTGCQDQACDPCTAHGEGYSAGKAKALFECAIAPERQPGSDPSGRRGWKQPCLRPRLGIPPWRSSGGGWKTRFISPWQDGILLPIPARGAAG